MKLIYRVVIFILFVYPNRILLAQAPHIQWQKSFGGSLDEVGYSIINSNNGGYLIVGYTRSIDGNISNHSIAGDSDFWLIRVDSLGNLVWEKCLGGSGIDVGLSALQNFENDYIIAGRTTSNDGDINGGLHGGNFGSDDFWVVKTDSGGAIIWQKCFGGTNSDEGKDIIQTRDSGFLVTGYVTSNDGDVMGFQGGEDVWVVKINQNGIKQWVKAFGGSDWDEGSSGVQTLDGGYLIASETLSSNGDVIGLHSNITGDVWIVKLDSVGQFKWQKCYGGTATDYPNKIFLSNNGDFFVSATVSSSNGDVTGLYGSYDLWLMKADSSGNILWEKCYGGANIEEGRTASPTSDGGIVLAGTSEVDNGMINGNHGFQDFWVVKVDSLGNYEWSKCIGGTGQDVPYSIKQTPDSGYIVVGYTESNDGDVTFNHGGKDVWVVKLSPVPVSVPELENSLMDLNIFQNNEQLILRFFSKQNDNLQIFIYDINGKKVLNEELMVSEGINYSKLNCSGLVKGMYFVTLEGNKGLQREKIVVQ